MTHRKSFSLALSILFFFYFGLAARVHASANTEGNDNSTSTRAAKQTDAGAQGKQVPVSMDGHSKAPQGKTHTPHSEELPHIHKFHKERVKKIRKHHGKYWLLSQVLLFLCHASVLYISYLHVVH